MEAISRFSGINYFQPFFVQQRQREREGPAVADNQPQTPQQADTRQQTASQQGEAAEQLTPEEQKTVRELQQRDREVRQHEQAHKMAAGAYAMGGPHFEFQRGPDGRLYAVGGEVQIDTSPIPGNPEATIRKAQVIRRAALAPSNPSSQDGHVAAQAGAMEREARAELRKKQLEETQEGEVPRQKGITLQQEGEASRQGEEPSPSIKTLNPTVTKLVHPGTFIDLLA